MAAYTPIDVGGTPWYTSWFDSPYYPILYAHRDEAEAQAFLENLMAYLGLPQGADLLDLACGNGRHSRALAQLGYRVMGVDLAQERLNEAMRDAMPNLAFQRLDMRDLEDEAAYDAVLNLFTSFGYFDDPADHLAVLRGVKRALKPGGTLVLDYLNAQAVLDAKLPQQQMVQRGDITFRTLKQIEAGQPYARVRKFIEVTEGPRCHQFQESVALITPQDFQSLVAQTDGRIDAVWGDYKGSPYDPGTSPRYIAFVRW